MSRETAVTEEIDYRTVDCEICGTEVATDPVPSDVIDSKGYAVVLGEGQVTSAKEKRGNWEVEHQFTLSKENNNLPHVEGCIICEHCATEIHGFDTESDGFTGSIPSDINSGSPNRIDQKDSRRIGLFAAVLLIAVIFIMVILLF